MKDLFLVPCVSCIHACLAQKNGTEAQRVLEQIQQEPSIEPEERLYLRAWLLTVQGQWEELLCHFHPWPLLLEPEQQRHLLTHGTFRRRRPISLLLIGEMARSLGYLEEASEHFHASLALLNERRMNIPIVRLLALLCLGRLALERHQPVQARRHYEAALHEWHEESGNQALYITLLTGLCESYVRLRQWESACQVGTQVLDVLPEDALQHQLQVLFLLGRVSLACEESASALAYAERARHVAQRNNDPASLGEALLLLTQIQHQACQLQVARATCQQALALLAPSQTPSTARALFLAGAIEEDQGRSHADQASLKEALIWYIQAYELFSTLQDTASLARVSVRIAQLLEGEGNTKHALKYWKEAYRVEAGLVETPI